MSDEGTPTPFIDLSPGFRVFAVEEVRQRLRELAEKVGHPLPEDSPLSVPADAWLKRLRGLLCEVGASSDDVLQMDSAMREALPEAEAEKLRKRLIEFEAIRDGIPLGATSTAEAIEPVVEHLLRREAARS
jgi:hypothetical protein